MDNKFLIQLENGELYLMEIGYNLQKYVIKKGYLYKNHKKLGKIIGVKTYDKQRSNYTIKCSF